MTVRVGIVHIYCTFKSSQKVNIISVVMSTHIKKNRQTRKNQQKCLCSIRTSHEIDKVTVIYEAVVCQCILLIFIFLFFLP